MPADAVATLYAANGWTYGGKGNAAPPPAGGYQSVGGGTPIGKKNLTPYLIGGGILAAIGLAWALS